MHRKGFAILSTAIVFLASMAMVSIAGGAPTPRGHDPNLVRLLGRETFEANALVTSTFRFSPEREFLHTGERVRWIDQDHVPDPHTMTVVRKSQLPTSFAEAFACEPCNDALDAHFGTTPPTTRVDVGASGFGQPGDSLLILDGASIGATVSAPAGTSVFYVCALHPWMQGSLRVG